MPFVPLPLPFTVESARLTLALDLSFVRPRVDAPSLRLKGGGSRWTGSTCEKNTPRDPGPLATLRKLDIAIGDLT